MRIVDVGKKENKNLTKIEGRTVHVARVCIQSQGKAIREQSFSWFEPPPQASLSCFRERVGEWGETGETFFSFSRPQTPHCQCNRSCLRRRLSYFFSLASSVLRALRFSTFLKASVSEFVLYVVRLNTCKRVFKSSSRDLLQKINYIFKRCKLEATSGALNVGSINITMIMQIAELF